MTFKWKQLQLISCLLTTIFISCKNYNEYKLQKLWKEIANENDIEMINRDWRELISIRSSKNIEYFADALLLEQQVGREGKPIYLDAINWLQELVPIKYEFNGNLFMTDKQYRHKIRENYLIWIRENKSSGEIQFDPSKKIFVTKNITAEDIQAHKEWLRGDKHWH